MADKELTQKEFASKKDVWNKGKYIPIEQRFWKFVKKGNDCWEWTGDKNSLGYGVIRFKKKNLKAHRVSYKLNKSVIPAGLSVCHFCDNPSCVNPKHLFLGTHQDNMNDRDKKGRLAKGDKSVKAKLTNQQVIEIRDQFSKHNYYGMQKDLTKVYGISKTEMCLIVHNKRFIIL